MEELATYLNDHLAGSVAALELLDRLITAYEGKSIGQFFRDLRGDIEADQQTLRGLIERLGAKESAVRKAGAWLMEKFSRAKMRVEDSKEGDAGLFIALETLTLGIDGKRGLWTALRAASDGNADLKGLNYVELERRAVDQMQRVDRERLKIARHAFAAG